VTTHKLLALVGIGLCAYGFYCVLHMHEYIGTPYYWSNPWFYKSSAAMCAVVALRIGMTLKVKK
jgi:hypothetical protein